MLEERQLLVVKIDLDIGIADGEQLAVPVAVQRRVDLAGLPEQQLMEQLLDGGTVSSL